MHCPFSVIFFRVEHSVYALLRTRDMAMSRYREFGIPVDWLSDSGVVGKVSLKTKERNPLVVVLICVILIIIIIFWC